MLLLVQTLPPTLVHPAITVPMGYTAQLLPFGLQLLARPWEEGTLLGIAYSYEQYSRQRAAPMLMPECTGHRSQPCPQQWSPQAKLGQWGACRVASRPGVAASCHLCSPEHTCPRCRE